jgi:magnesium transporter
VSLRQSATAGQAVDALRGFAGDLETLTHVFLVDGHQVLQGIVPLVKVLLAPPESELAVLAEGYHVVSCDVQASGKKVEELFDKYNLRALPVVTAEKKLAGVIYAEQVIALLRTKS